MYPDTATRPFLELFADQTLRVDTLHGDNPQCESIQITCIEAEGRWTGPRRIGPEPFRLGDYRYSIIEIQTGERIHAGGYNSFFEEWTSTPDAAAGQTRGFHESIRIPCPRVPAMLRIERIHDQRRALVLLEQPLVVCPATSMPGPACQSFSVIEGRPGDRSVQLLLVSEGYTEAEEPKFRADAARFGEILFSVEPYRSRRRDFHVRAGFLPSKESGITDPASQRYLQTAFGASFNVFGIDRYMLTFDNQGLRRACAGICYDALVVLCNTAKYGGGGVFNQYCCLATDTPYSNYLFLHELGHSFAGLGDEYFAAHVTYQVDDSPAADTWVPNVSHTSQRELLKWRSLVEPGTPLPSPWDQARYCELVAACNAAAERAKETGVSDTLSGLLAEVRQHLRAEPLYGKVGAFEGAQYRRTGLFRAELDCLMFGRTADGFCRACTQAIHQRIDDLLAEAR